MLKRPCLSGPYSRGTIQAKDRATTAPPVYRPATVRETLQTKGKAIGGAPPVYQPFPAREVLQAKSRFGNAAIEPRHQAATAIQPQLQFSSRNRLTPNVLQPKSQLGTTQPTLPKTSIVQLMSLRTQEYVKDAFSYDAIAKRVGDKNQNAANNYATMCFIFASDFYYVTVKNVGMQSTHAEEMCYRAMVSRIEELSGKKLSIYDTVKNIEGKTGKTLEINWIYSEREPCTDCENFIDGKAGHKNTPAYYTVKYRNVTWQESQDELAAEMESFF